MQYYKKIASYGSSVVAWETSKKKKNREGRHRENKEVSLSGGDARTKNL